jgi:hypothetical protein
VIDDDDDGEVTPAELEAAQARWGTEGTEAFGTELFSRPIVEDGLRGDVPIGADPPMPPVGTRVTAKRLGWDDGPEAEDDPDHTPYSEMGYASPDLEGELTAVHFELPDGRPGTVWSVGGQPADPKSVQPAA